ncbi:MAG: signal peptidase II [Thermodesulfobacteriota bacterium]
MADRIQHLIFAAVTALVLIFDQITKYWILRTVALHSQIVVIPGCFNIVHVQNPGGAFGLFASESGMFRALLFVALAIVAIGLIFYLHYRTPARYRMLTVGLALIFSGAVGNLIDRLRFGKVIDFIDVYVGTYHWPAFNVADSAITVGMVIFGYYILFKKVPA